MPEPLRVWIGTRTSGGIPRPARVDVPPPPHWRLEAIAATERPRSLDDRAPTGARPSSSRIATRPTSGCSISRRGALAAPHDRTRSAAVLGGHAARRVARRSHRRVRRPKAGSGSSPLAGGPPRKVVEAGSPAWLGDDRLVVSVERDRCRGSPSSRRRRSLAAAARAASTATSTSTATSRRRSVSPDGSTVAFVFVPHPDYSRYEISVVDVATGRGARRSPGAPGIRDNALAWSPDGTTIAFASERSGWYELHLIAADGTGERQLTTARGGLLRGAVASRRRGRVVCSRGAETASISSRVDATSGSVTACPRRDLGRAALDGDGRASSPPTRTPATPPELRARRRRCRAAARCTAPAPLAVRAAPYVLAEELTYTSFDGREIQAFLYRPAGRLGGAPAPVVVNPHGGPADCYGDEWDGHAQYFVDKGYALARVQLPRLDGARQRVRAARTTATGASGTRRTASPPRTSCARSTGSTASGSASSARATGRTWRCSR